MFSLYVCIWTVITSSLCILMLHLLLKNTSLLIRYGLGFFVLTCILCMLRLFTPLEFSCFQHKYEFPHWISLLLKPLSLSWHGISISCLWIVFSLSVSLILLIRFILKTRKGCRLLYDHSQATADYNETLHLIDPDCKLPIRRTDLLTSPVIIGYFHPTIYISHADYGSRDIYNILKHEYTHYRYHHLMLKLGLKLMTILFWWDPFIYLLQRDISHIIELICDERSMQGYESRDRNNYLRTLMNTMRRLRGMELLEQPDGPVENYLGFASCVNKGSTEQRLTYHMSQDPARRRRSPLLIFRKLLLCSFALFWMLASYYVIFQPAYEPQAAEIQEADEDPDLMGAYSNERNAYLVEQGDGSYVFYFMTENYGLTSVEDIPAAEVEAGYYSIYTTISYEDYKDLGDYTESQVYRDFLKDADME